MNKTSNTVFPSSKGATDISEYQSNNAAAIYGATINQDAKMSFKDYIELHKFQS